MNLTQLCPFQIQGTTRLLRVDSTMASGYSVTLDRMVCYMMSILTRHNAAEYSVHWDWLFDPYTTLQWDDDVNNFIDYYPGNTCDYSS